MTPGRQIPETFWVVPARGGSKRLPGKNLRPLAGRSLLAHTMGHVRGAGIADPVTLSTDNPELAAEGRSLGYRVPFLRPAKLASDAATTAAAVLHALDEWSDTAGSDPEWIVLLQPTSPLRGSNCITYALDLAIRNTEAAAIVTVKPLDRTAVQVFRREGRFLAHLQTSGPADGLVTPNGALYMVRTAEFRRSHNFVPPGTLPVMMDSIASIDIDTAADWQLAEAALAAGLQGSVTVGNEARP